MLCKHGNINYQDNYRVISKRYAVIELFLTYFKNHDNGMFIGNPCTVNVLVFYFLKRVKLICKCQPAAEFMVMLDKHYNVKYPKTRNDFALRTIPTAD